MKNFALTGAGGYVAPRHFQAIKDTGNTLVACIDPHDSVGILDRYFPQTSYFVEYERFDRHLELLRRKGDDERIHYMSICSPNYLHDAHIRLALRLQANAICEKPLVLNPWNLDSLEELENETGNRVYTIFQLRVHPSLQQLHQTLHAQPKKHKHEVCLTYITPRGPWYHYSWKGVKERSGGLATNIGVHFFDLLMWLFGDVQNNKVTLAEPDRMSGFLEHQHANVHWYLSVRKEDLPAQSGQSQQTTFRSITIDGKEIEFTEGFTNLHTRVYEETLRGNGFGIQDARPSLQLVYDIRNAGIEPDRQYWHPFLLVPKKV
jgi:UDP-N-acetyl-2-amino-2-deoxyglucuronate dehydrogenase